MSRASISGHFIDGAKGPIFVLVRRPLTAARGCVLVVQPFAEEMNKCRRMVTEVALGLAERGVTTVVPDLYGTGDSGGDFSDAAWDMWQSDVACAVRWSAESGCPVTGILAIRLGCALAAGALGTGGVPPVGRSALWQPVFDGGRFLTQFLRLRIAANLTEDRKESVAELRALLKAGTAIQIAGYGLPGRLACDLESVTAPEHLPAGLGDTAWFEIVREAGGHLPEPSLELIRRSASRIGHVRAKGFAGDPYWTATEIVVHREIVAETVLHLAGSKGRGAH